VILEESTNEQVENIDRKVSLKSLKLSPITTSTNQEGKTKLANTETSAMTHGRLKSRSSAESNGDAPIWCRFPIRYHLYPFFSLPSRILAD